MTGDRSLDAALDRFTVPPLSAGFADRVLARTEGRATVAVSLPPRRDRRGAWSRARTILIGFATLSLISAGAAATGMFGDVAKNVPVLGSLIARVAPAPNPVPVRVVIKAKPAPALPSAIAKRIPPAFVDAAPIEIAPPFAALRDERREVRREIRRAFRREIIARRLVTRMDERRAARRAAGLPVQSVPPRALIRRWRMLPPEERFAIRQRMREIRQARRAERETGTPNLDAPVTINPTE
jgi:hypothetical protein